MRRDLTPTEERILDYLAEGLYDAEIAVRLGLPVQDLKQRITRILQREHLLDRAHLVEWWQSGQESPQAATLQPNESGSSKRVLFVAAIVAVAFVAMPIAAILLPGGDSDSPADGRASGTPAPDDLRTQIVEHSATMAARLKQTATAGGAYWIITPTAGGSSETWEGIAPLVDAEPFHVRDTSMSPGEALIVQRRDERLATTAIERLVIGNSGVLETHEVWVAPDGVVVVRPAVLSVTGARIAMGSSAIVNDGGDPHSLLIVGTIEGDFDEPFDLPAGYYPAFFAGEKVAIAPATETSTIGWQLYDPATRTLEGLDSPPVATSGPVGWSPTFGILWPVANGMIVEKSGGPIMQVGSPGASPIRIERFFIAASDGLLGGTLPGFSAEYAVVSWWAGEDSPMTSLVSFEAGSVLRTWSGQFWPVGLAFGGNFIGSFCEVQCRPARLSIQGLVLQRFSEPFLSTPLPSFPLQSGIVVGSQRGPFARVPDDADSCVPLLVAPEPNSLALHCAKPGDLLPLHDVSNRLSGNAEPSAIAPAGTMYVAVQTPAGEPAWVQAGTIELEWVYQGMIR